MVREEQPGDLRPEARETQSSTAKSWSVRVASILSRDDWLVIGWVLAISVLLFIFGTKAYQILANKRIVGFEGWLELWSRWDADQYLRLAKFGYTSDSIWKAWLYPLYPWCIRFVAWIAGNYVVSALIVSETALFFAAVLLRRLVSIDFASDVALRSVWFLLIFPTAYFLHVCYTESLFLALVIGSVLAARRGRWWLAGLLGALSWMTRANGIILLPTLAVEAAHQFWTTRRWNWRWLWIGIVPAGFAVYLMINWKVSGAPFAFLQSRKALFTVSASWPWTGLQGTIGVLQHWKPTDSEIIGAQELYFIILGFICAVAAWCKLRPTYAMWITGNWLLVTSASWLLSMPRYTLVMFPIFILFALVARNRLFYLLITIWSLLFLALFESLFVWGHWAF
jgi:Mannosyltransferase (PIG-V)